MQSSTTAAASCAGVLCVQDDFQQHDGLEELPKVRKAPCAAAVAAGAACMAPAGAACGNDVGAAFAVSRASFSRHKALFE